MLTEYEIKTKYGTTVKHQSKDSEEETMRYLKILFPKSEIKLKGGSKC